MAESSNKNWRRRRNMTNRPRKAKRETLPSSSHSSESESSTKTLGGSRNWIDMPNDVTASILSRLSMFDVLESAQKVCLTWRRICKDPMTWRTIRMEFDIDLHLQKVTGDLTSAKRKKHLTKFHNFNAHKMCHHAVDLSRGNLVDISIQNCGTDEPLKRMIDSSRGIRRLSIVFSPCITMKGLSKVASKLPLTEDLEISYTPSYYGYSGYPDYEEDSECLGVIGRSCPLLKSLKLNTHPGCTTIDGNDNLDAFEIGRTMHGLQNLHLFGNWLSHKGLHAILEGCPRLESLDLRRCIHLELNRKGWGYRPLKEYRVDKSHLEDLKRRCYKQIRKLRVTDDSVDDYEYLGIEKIVDRRYWKYNEDAYMYL